MRRPDNKDWQTLLGTEIQEFIHAHRYADVHALALKKPPDPGWPYALILDQIAARQKAARKIPGWLAVDNIVLPPSGLIEQASSASTASYKASLVSGERFIDLTAGAGVDTAAFAARFKAGDAVERDSAACRLLSHNLPLLSANCVRVHPGDAETLLPDLTACDFIYLDPQRRDAGRKGIFRLEACSPDVLFLLPMLRKKAARIMIKTSPMLDIDLAVRMLETVEHIHVVEWRGDCREVLYVLGPAPCAEPAISAVILDDDGHAAHTLRFTRAEEAGLPLLTGPPETYLFEPSPSMQKAGGLRMLAARHGLRALHAGTNLLTGPAPCPDFPGRAFRILGIYGGSGKDLPLRQANLTVRNFPMTAEALRKKLKLRDGGNDTLFACTLADGRKALIHAVKDQASG